MGSSQTGRRSKQADSSPCTSLSMESGPLVRCGRELWRVVCYVCLPGSQTWSCPAAGWSWCLRGCTMSRTRCQTWNPSIFRRCEPENRLHICLQLTMPHINTTNSRRAGTSGTTLRNVAVRAPQPTMAARRTARQWIAAVKKRGAGGGPLSSSARCPCHTACA
jgi:hypothetical protein